MGTGGFIFENRNEGNLYHLIKNDKWWGGEVYLDSVKVKLLPDKDSAMYAFSLGEISLCPAEKDDWGKFMDAKTSDYMPYSYGNYNFLGYNYEMDCKIIDELFYTKDSVDTVCKKLSRYKRPIDYIDGQRR